MATDNSRWKMGIIAAIALALGLVAYQNLEFDAPTSVARPSNPEWTKEKLKKKLTKMQFYVTQEEGTERPFANEYWDNKRPGIYVDIVSGEPLFSSTDKFSSGTGWPSFTKPIEGSKIIEKKDITLGLVRTEVRSQISHLGHVFDDGPAPTGKRYCINSAALKFIPASELKTKGFAQYLHLFEGRMPASKKESDNSDLNKKEIATFAGGCFWCMEPPFEKLVGVGEVISGYMGGHKKNPTYEEVSAGSTGHTEVVQVHFDPKVITYEQLLEVFWRNINPTTPDRQFVDVGSQYRPEVFFHSEAQKKVAEKSRMKLAQLPQFKGQKIATPVTAASIFYKAEEYHQDYYVKKPLRYKYYRYRSGRDQYLDRTWGKKRTVAGLKIKKGKIK